MHKCLILLLMLTSCCAAQEGKPIDPEPTDDSESWHLRADYLYWYLRRLPVPPLLTAGPTGSSGILGERGTIVLRGGDRLPSRHDRYIGVRVNAERGLDAEHVWTAEIDAFFLERDSTHFTVRQSDVPVLAVPFVENGRPASFVVSGFNPKFGELLGGSRVYSRMELFGQEGNLRYNLSRSPGVEWNLFAGARFLQLRERLDITSSAVVLPTQTTVIGLEDHIQTFDKFYGAQAGVSGVRRFGRWALDGRAAIALGGDDQLIRNKGVRIVHVPGQRTARDVGLFVRPSNRGSFRRTSFDGVTEARLNVAYDLTDHVRVNAGWSVLTWDGPVRPGSQVQSPPRPNFHEDFFVAQGLNLGLELHW